MRKHNCDGCGKQIKKRSGYCLRIELFASGEVEFDEEELWQDLSQAREKLNQQINKMDPKKLEEEVYVAYNLSLCKRCRDKFSQRVKCKEFI